MTLLTSWLTAIPSVTSEALFPPDSARGGAHGISRSAERRRLGSNGGPLQMLRAKSSESRKSDGP